MFQVDRGLCIRMRQRGKKDQRTKNLKMDREEREDRPKDDEVGRVQCLLTWYDAVLFSHALVSGLRDLILLSLTE